MNTIYEIEQISNDINSTFQEYCLNYWIIQNAFKTSQPLVSKQLTSPNFGVSSLVAMIVAVELLLALFALFVNT